MINDVADDDEPDNGKNHGHVQPKPTDTLSKKNLPMDVDDDNVRKSGDGLSEEETVDEGNADDTVTGVDLSESIMISESDEESIEPSAKRAKVEESQKRISQPVGSKKEMSAHNQNADEVMVRTEKKILILIVQTCIFLIEYFTACIQRWRQAKLQCKSC